MTNEDSVFEPEKPPSSVVISAPLVQKDPEQSNVQQQPEVILIQTTPCACIASAILRKPATFAPKT